MDLARPSRAAGRRAACAHRVMHLKKSEAFMSASVTRARDESAHWVWADTTSAHTAGGRHWGLGAAAPSSDASTSRIRMFIVLEIRPLEHYMRPARGLRAVGHRWMDECDSTLDSQRGTAYGSIAPAGRAHRDFPPSRRHSDFRRIQATPAQSPPTRPPAWSPRLSMLLHLITVMHCPLRPFRMNRRAAKEQFEARHP